MSALHDPLVPLPPDWEFLGHEAVGDPLGECKVFQRRHDGLRVVVSDGNARLSLEDRHISASLPRGAPILPRHVQAIKRYFLRADRSIRVTHGVAGHVVHFWQDLGPGGVEAAKPS